MSSEAKREVVAVRHDALVGAFRWSEMTIVQHKRIVKTLAELPPPRTPADRSLVGRSLCDARFFVYSARMLSQATDQLRDAHPALTMPPEMQEHVRVLRNCIAHWDEARSGRAFDELERLVGHRNIDTLIWSVDAPDLTFGGLRLDHVFEFSKRIRPILNNLLPRA
ncbi:hypothetical protein [Ilumatobacter sp.]|uniref:hypothetical protein n=1 Tax=Ilumatobacter sp. TaxID=1967498 RepID=UPI003B52D99A